MPTVPTINGPGVQEQALTGGMQTTVASPELLSGNADQLVKLGQAGTNLADAYDRIKERDESDKAFTAEIKVKSAAIEFEDQTRKRMQGANAKGITGEMEKFWAEQSDALDPSLSPYAKRLALRSLAVAKQQSISSTGNYEAAELDKAQTGAWMGAKGVEVDRAAHSMDETVAATSVQVLREKNAQQAALKGWSAERLAFQNQEDTQGLHKAMLNAFLGANDLDKAEAYVKKNSQAMDVNDVLTASSLIKKQRDTRDALVVATDSVRRAEVAANPTPITRLATIAGELDFNKLNTAKRIVESGNRDLNKDGTVVTSGKGAKGRDQVVDSTNIDPGFGVTPARDNSLAERSRVGTDYLQAMIKRYGDIPKALAAYNAGPGAMDEALTKAKGGDWLALLPKETQDYVPKVLNTYASAPTAPTARPTLQDIHNDIRTKLGMGNPEKLKLSLDEASRQYDETTKAIKQREDEGEKAAITWLSQNGGKFSMLPPALRAGIPADKIDNVMTAGQKFAKGDDITNPWAFQRLATDDAYLKGMSDVAYYNATITSLSRADKEKMDMRRATLLNGPKGQSDKDLDFGTVNSLFNNRLVQMGLDPSPKDGSNAAQKIGVQRQVVWDAVMAAQLQAGKKFTDVDMANTIDRLFTTNVKFRTSFMGASTGETSTPVLNLTTSDLSDVSPDIITDLKKRFATQGIPAPTQEQLLGAYMRFKLQPTQTVSRN